MDTGFVVEGNFPKITTKSVVIATGGLSIPKIGATEFGIKIAQDLVWQMCQHAPGNSSLSLMQGC